MHIYIYIKLKHIYIFVQLQIFCDRIVKLFTLDLIMMDFHYIDETKIISYIYMYVCT